MTSMPDYYQPDDNAYPNALNAIKLLSQRDVALHIPVNFVPVLGVSLSTCVVDDRYDLNITRCFSNLLAAGFRRFDIDLYWDESLYSWTLCPVQLGGSHGTPTSSTSSTSIAIPAASRPSTAALSARIVIGEVENDRDSLLYVRQTTSTQAPVSLLSAAIGQTTSPASQSTSAASAVETSGSDSQLTRVGQYTCSRELDIGVMLSVLTSHLDLTENNLNATVNYISLNIHAASADPANQASAPSRLPGSDRALAALISRNASDYLYTPTNLQLQRADLNATGSWYNVPQDVLPDSSYFTVTAQDSTPDGWPTESFIEFTRYRRLLVSFGQIQPEMDAYNLSADTTTIFPPGYIASNFSHTFSPDGSLQSGCFYNPATTDLNTINNSWAIADMSTASSQVLLDQAGNLTDCGFTAVLNSTLTNVTAEQEPMKYGDFVLRSIWSWDTAEPRSNGDHCAVLNSTTGRWQVESCTASHHCACDTGTPYGWQISTQQLSYDRTDQACPSGTSFGVSRTALENAYLVNAWRTIRGSSSISDELLWINLNDISVTDCWVEGQNTTCPYQPQDTSDSRTITVPTVSGVIILVLTVLTIVIKCGSNRRATRRRRRRAGDSIEYEGVPS